MKIKEFSVNALQKHSLWYLLKKQYKNDIDIVRPTAAGNEPWLDVEAYKMFNGSILLGFSHPTKTIFAQGLVAIGDGITEHISTQAYERIDYLVNIKPPNDNFGTFSFVDSQPVPINSGRDWRCDVSYYGPMPFPDLEGNKVQAMSDKSVLVTFEPILSIPGTAHLIYLRRTDYADARDYHVNHALTPMTACTLSECIKLIYEWSQVSHEPFNNIEDIAVDAKKFCEILGITEDLVSPYPDMQIAKFLSGNPKARNRPDNPVGPTEPLIQFIRRNTAHMSLASLLSINPGVWDVRDIAELEQTSIDLRKQALFKDLLGREYPEDGILPQFAIDSIGPFLTQWFEYFDKAKDISKGLM